MHSGQIGTVLARSSTRSHSRQPAGKNTLTSASPAPDSHPLTRFSKLDRPATLAEAYSVLSDKQRGNVPEGKSLKRDQNCSAATGLQQPLFVLFLAVDAVLGPRHSFQP